jgi:hypothetical protein
MKLYIPKVKHWKVEGDEYTATTYVFLGELSYIDTKLATNIIKKKVSDEDEAKLKALLGNKYKQTLLLGQDKVVYKGNTFYKDDSLYIARKKICHFLSLGDYNKTYMWYEKESVNDPAVIYYFVSQCFKKSQSIKSKYFLQCVSNFFDISLDDDFGTHIDRVTATKMLFQQKLSKTRHPLLFQYTYDGFVEFIPASPVDLYESDELPDVSGMTIANTFTMLVESFDIHNDTIHVIEEAEVDDDYVDMFFPYKNMTGKLNEDEAGFIDTLCKAEEAIYKVTIPEGIENTTIINHVHIRGNNPLFNAKVSLDGLFNEYVTTELVPFVKLKTPSNVYYKIHRSSLSSIPKDDIEKWTKLQNSKDDKSFIVFKIRYSNNVYYSLILNNDLTYTLKVNLGLKEHQEEKHVRNIFPVVNQILQYVSTIFDNSFIPVIPNDILVSSQEHDVVKVVQVVTHTTLNIKSMKLHPELLITIIKQTMYPYFSLIEEVGTSDLLHIQYKRTSNYAKNNNMLSFIQKHIMLPPEELVKQLMAKYTISSKDAIREIESFKSEFNKDNKYYGFSRFDNSINIKLKHKGQVDVKYMINGLPNIEVSERIHKLLAAMLVLSDNKKKLEKLQSTQDVVDVYEKQQIELENTVTLSREGTPTSPVENMMDDMEELADVDIGTTEMDDDLDEDLLELQNMFLEEQAAKEEPENKSDNKVEVDDKVQVVDTEKKGKPTEKAKDIPKQGLEKTKIKGYVLSKLKAADPDLFTKDYASTCGWVDRRQPVVISKEELDTIKDKYPKAINGYVKSGTTEELEEKNYYICPKIWCPKSRVALSYEDYAKHGNKCPYPEIEEEPILFASKSYFGEGEKGLTKDRYPSFLDKYVHPDQFCLPCCFKVSAKEGNRNNQRKELCVSKFAKKEGSTKKSVEEEPIKTEDAVEMVGNDRYIKSANYSPLESGRFGLLPRQLVEFLGQEGKQGQHHDGTRAMTNKTDGLFRKGIVQTKESFLDAIVSVLNNGKISNSKDLLNTIIENLDILTYISLEGGRIMKMFIDTSRPIFDPLNFKQFYEWFKTQKKYIIRMNLDVILREIEAEDVISFDNDKLYHHHDILREYIIYCSYQNFIKYLQNNRVKKEHIILLDLICNKMQNVININKYNFVILDYDPDNDKMYINCNVNTSSNFDLNYPFIVILKRNSYYEPIYHVKVADNNIIEQDHLLYFKQTTQEIRSLLNFFMKNCAPREVSYVKSVSQQLANIGFKPKYYVIDYGYKTCGIIVNHNIYIPLPARYDMFYEQNIKYVYISDVPKFKCLLSNDEIRNVYNKVKKITGNDFYKIKATIFDKQKLVGITINQGDTFVPLNVTSEYYKLRMTHNNGLYILIGHEETDERAKHTERFFKKNSSMMKLVKSVKGIMEKDREFKTNMDFLLDKNNPLPLLYKKNKLHKLIYERLPSEALQIDDVTTYELYNYLQDRVKYDLYTLRTKRFSHTDDEILYDHMDIRNGKLNEAIKFAENPYLALMHTIDTLQNAYVFGETEIDTYEDIINSNNEVNDVPVKWRKILIGFKTVSMKTSYTNKYILNIFNRISKETGGVCSDETFFTSSRNNVTEEFERNNFQEIVDNPWMASYLKKNKLEKTLDNVLDGYKHINYYHSTYDVKLMARLAKVNLIMIGRTTQKNPDGLEVSYNNSNYYIVLLYSYDRVNVLDMFELFIHKDKFLFRKEDLPVPFLQIINKAIKVYNVDIEE